MAMDELRICKLEVLIYKSPALIIRQLGVDTQDQFTQFYQVNGTYALAVIGIRCNQVIWTGQWLDT